MDMNRWNDTISLEQHTTPRRDDERGSCLVWWALLPMALVGVVAFAAVMW